MMKKENILLIEIGTEELPPKDLQKLSLAFKEIFSKELENNLLTFREIISFATPRRLALQIFGLPDKQQNRTVGKRGPAIKDAFDSKGNPSKAALGFASSCKVEIEKLQKQETQKGAWLYFEETVFGNKTIELIPEILEKTLTNLPISKRMRWGEQQQSFVRPVHWLALLFNEQIVEAKIFGIQSSRNTYGHRFHHPQQISLQHANAYEATLEQKGFVIPSFEKRLNTIKTDATAIAKKTNSELLVDNLDLLELINGLVEYPVALLCSFNKEYLSIPQEALIASMQEHQKCIPIIDQKGKLKPNFILISNIKSNDPNAVIKGNELVMHARLADAAFLFKEDQKYTLESRIDRLKTITFQAKLGTIYEKTLRIEKLALLVAEEISANKKQVKRVSQLCKSDLTAQMVYEFPELQGTMGRYYAVHDKEDKDVAIAIEEHYLPRFSNDVLPQTLPGMCVAIADRMDTLIGLFAINKTPTGEKDPFALKRQALAILRIIIEKELSLNLQTLIEEAYFNYAEKIKNKSSISNLIDFFFDRLKFWYLSNDGNAKVFESVLAKKPTRPYDFYKRLIAVQLFQSLPEAESLSAANKRVKNILDQAKEFSTSTVDINLFDTEIEKKLFKAIQQKEKEIEPLIKKSEFTNILKSLASLKEPVDLFFDKVMVMVDDIKVRNNRLNLLYRLRGLFLQVADLSEL